MLFGAASGSLLGSCVKSDALFRGSLGSTGCGFSLTFQKWFQAHRTEDKTGSCSCPFVAVAVLVDVALMVPRIKVPRLVQGLVFGMIMDNLLP